MWFGRGCLLDGIWSKLPMLLRPLWSQSDNYRLSKEKNSSVCLLMSPFFPFQFTYVVQVNIFQKHLFLYQLTHKMTKDCLLNYKFSTWKLHVVCINCSACQNKQTICVHNMYWTCNSMNNLSSYCGLVNARISASDIDLPVL